jgi:hypothetical protein
MCCKEDLTCGSNWQDDIFGREGTDVEKKKKKKRLRKAPYSSGGLSNCRACASLYHPLPIHLSAQDEAVRHGGLLGQLEYDLSVTASPLL